MEIAGALNEPRSTIADWLKRIETNGLSDICDVKNKGAACKLSRGQLESLARDLEAGPAAAGLGADAWTMPLVRTHIKKKYRKQYHVRSVWDLVRRLGFSYTEPGPGDMRGASRQKIATFTTGPQDGQSPRWTQVGRIPRRARSRA